MRPRVGCRSMAFLHTFKGMEQYNRNIFIKPTIDYCYVMIDPIPLKVWITPDYSCLEKNHGLVSRLIRCGHGPAEPGERNPFIQKAVAASFHRRRFARQAFLHQNEPGTIHVGTSAFSAPLGAWSFVRRLLAGDFSQPLSFAR